MPPPLAALLLVPGTFQRCLFFFLWRVTHRKNRPDRNNLHPSCSFTPSIIRCFFNVQCQVKKSAKVFRLSSLSLIRTTVVSFKFKRPRRCFQVSYPPQYSRVLGPIWGDPCCTHLWYSVWDDTTIQLMSWPLKRSRSLPDSLKLSQRQANKDVGARRGWTPLPLYPNPREWPAQLPPLPEHSTIC